MSILYARRVGEQTDSPVNEENPLPVEIIPSPILPSAQLLIAEAVATGAGRPIELNGAAAAVFQIIGSFTATVTWEASLTDVWVAVNAVNLNDGTVATTATAAGLFGVNAPGAIRVRARISSWTAGRVNVYGHAVEGGTFGSASNAAGQNVTPVGGSAGESALKTDGDTDLTPTGIPVFFMADTVTGAQREVSNTYPFPVQQAALGANDLPLVAGTVAHDAADSGNPVKIGGKVVTALATTALAAGDRADMPTATDGRQITSPYANPENLVSGVTSDMTGTSTTSLVAADRKSTRLNSSHRL